MSGSATIAITVGIAVAVLVGFFIVYYLGNVANSVYDIKVGVRKDFDKKVKELQDAVEKDTKQRINWMREENKEENKKLQVSLQDNLEEKYVELERTVERLRADVTSLQGQLETVQKNPKSFSADPTYKKSVKKKEEAGPGSLDVPKVGVPDGGSAPDMEAVSKKPAPRGPKKTAQIENNPDEPLVEKAPLAGKASVQEKARKIRKPKNMDEFESFGTFSDDFKAGS